MPDSALTYFLHVVEYLANILEYIGQRNTRLAKKRSIQTGSIRITSFRQYYQTRHHEVGLMKSTKYSPGTQSSFAFTFTGLDVVHRASLTESVFHPKTV
jgi:hypothetical protein